MFTLIIRLPLTAVKEYLFIKNIYMYIYSKPSKFEHFSHSVLNRNVDYQGSNSQNTYQNSKQERS